MLQRMQGYPQKTGWVQQVQQVQHTAEWKKTGEVQKVHIMEEHPNDAVNACLRLARSNKSNVWRNGERNQVLQIRPTCQRINGEVQQMHLMEEWKKPQVLQSMKHAHLSRTGKVQLMRFMEK